MNKEIIYVPVMHSSLAPKGLPEEVLFLCPGLDSCFSARSACSENLPFTGREAEAVLREMVSQGQELGREADLKLLAGQAWLEREEARKKQDRGEAAALAAFAENGEVPGSTKIQGTGSSQPAAQNSNNRLINAQKALLLAWEHEECVLAMRELEDKLAASGHSLRSALGDGLAEVAVGSPGAILSSDINIVAAPSSPGKAGAAADFSVSNNASNKEPAAEPDYSWQVVLEAAAPFLPEGAALFTAFGQMVEDLRGMGILEPLPGEKADELKNWPEDILSALLFASLPLWRLLGQQELSPERPWLGKKCDIFVAFRPLPAGRNA